MRVVVAVITERQFRRRERRGGREKRRDLDLGGLRVGGAHKSVVLVGKTVKSAERVGRFFAGNLSIPFAHERVPHFNGAAPFKDVHPNRPSVGTRIMSIGLGVSAE